MKSKRVNTNYTTLVRIDRSVHELLKMKAEAEETTIRALIEGCLADILEVKHYKK